MTPLKPVSPATRVILGISFVVRFAVVWTAITLGGLVAESFLASPIAMLKSGWVLLTELGFIKDIGMTVWRVVGGFAIPAALAVPLGVLMGAYKPIEAF